MRKGLHIVGLSLVAAVMVAGSAGAKKPPRAPKDDVCDYHKGETPGNKIIFKMKGLRNDKGTVRCTIYKADLSKSTDSKKVNEDYPTKFEGRYDCNEVPLKKGEKEATCVFEGIEPGIYAIASMHDENDNKQFDMKNDIPTEGAACSRNAQERAGWGAPKFNDAWFEYTGGVLEMNEDSTDKKNHKQHGRFKY